MYLLVFEYVCVYLFYNGEGKYEEIFIRENFFFINCIV